ncbi:MAG: hypothetical protein WA812_03245 [Candidatus Cybelea sp.]
MVTSKRRIAAPTFARRANTFHAIREAFNMRYFRTFPDALIATAAVAFLAGCSSGASQSVFGASRPVQQSAAQSGANSQSLGRLPIPHQSGIARIVHRDHTQSWMAPDAKKADLLYLTDEGADDVYVYSWPRGELKGTLTGFDAPNGECVDKAGDVFVANEDESQILEYAHGGTSPIETLSDPGQYPVGCSVDPTTGNLAVTNIDTPKGGPGNVAIYTDALGSPTTYTAPYFYYYFFCGYDNDGNLYVDGTDTGSSFEFAELLSGSSSFETIMLNQGIDFPGGVQWDGKYVAVGDQEEPYIYEFTISGSSGTKVGSTQLDDTNDVAQFWKQGRKVVAPDFLNNEVQFFKYPAGGMATKTIPDISTPIGSVVSKSK